jgi:hypothetical protein
MRILNKEQIKKINKTALAEKHGCSQVYVSEILYGLKPNSTELSKRVVADAMVLTAIFETPAKDGESPFEMFDEVLCVHGGWLYNEEGAGVMTEKNYNSYVNRKRFWVLRRGGGRNTPALIAWNSIPHKYQKAVIEKFGNPEEALNPAR